MKIVIPLDATESVSSTRGRQRITYAEQNHNLFWEYNYYSEAETASMPTTRDLRTLVNRVAQKLRCGYVNDLYALPPTVRIGKQYQDVIEFSFIGYGFSKYDAAEMVDLFDQFMFDHDWHILKITRNMIRHGTYELVFRIQQNTELSASAETLYDPNMNQGTNSAQTPAEPVADSPE